METQSFILSLVFQFYFNIDLSLCCPGNKTYGKNCAKSCSSTCLNQTCQQDNGHCLGCVKGYYRPKCENSCENCNWDCDSSGGKCLGDCPIGRYGTFCYSVCQKNCFDGMCEKSGTCFDCKNGYYGSICSKRCKNNAELCDDSGNSVAECKLGYYGNKCLEVCSTNCFNRVCTRKGVCVNCQKGFYGLKCDLRCVDCPKCDRFGKCVSGGRFTVAAGITIELPVCDPGVGGGDQCDRDCYNKCGSGYCPDWKCTECENGYYRPECTWPCTKGPICDLMNGSAIPKCPTNSFGQSCEHTCSDHCEQRLCKRYTGTCELCAKDRLGLFCEKHCQFCETCDRHGTCTSECFPGKYGKRCKKNCNTNCFHGRCGDHGHCLECAPGFYGENCTLPCRSGDICDAKNGDWRTPCKAGFYGDWCANRCSTHCKNEQCSYFGTCLECNFGYFGAQCQYKCSKCEVCDRSGKCLSDCYPHLSGEYCRGNCPSACRNSLCTKQGACRECYKGYYGDTCSLKCQSSGFCNQLGEPMKDCKIGFYGQNCSVRCAENCVGSCTNLVGFCYWCKWGYYGNFCEHKCSDTGCSTWCSKIGACFRKSHSKKSAVVIPMVSTGVVMFVSLTLVAVMLVNRHIRAKEPAFVEQKSKVSASTDDQEKSFFL